MMSKGIIYRLSKSSGVFSGFVSEHYGKSGAWRLANVLHSQRWRSLHVENPPVLPSVTCSYVHGASSTPLLPLTVGQSLQATVERWPEREALVFLQDGIRKTFLQFQQDVDKAAAGLLALGLKRGDRLGVWGPNSYDWILFMFAAAKAGIILVPLNPANQLKELEFTLKKVQCNAVLCPSRFKSQDYCDLLRQACPELRTASSHRIQSASFPDLHMVIVMDSRQPGMLHVDDVMQAAGSEHHQQLHSLHNTLSFDEPICIQFTSGTTGSPKGATLSHHNIVNNAYLGGMRLGFNWRPQVRVCVPVPMYHCFGTVLGGVCMAQHGITLVFPSTAYDVRANLEAIQNERCTFLYGTPTMYIDMLEHPDLKKYDLSSAEAGIIGGSSCPEDVVRRVMSDMNIHEIMIGYGTTENSPITFLGFPWDSYERKTKSAGCILSHTEAKIVEPTSGQLVPLGSSGELMIRGYCVMLGYWDDPEKTQECITKDGWYKTGDIGSLDSFGYCHIEGRIKDMIIRGGENIYPAEIEQFLHTHPKVKAAQVIGVKDARLGEQLCACIQLRDGEVCSAEEIQIYCKGKIAHFKIPHHVVFVDDFPLTVSRKVQKHELRNKIKQSLGL